MVVMDPQSESPTTTPNHDGPELYAKESDNSNNKNSDSSHVVNFPSSTTEDQVASEKETKNNNICNKNHAVTLPSPTSEDTNAYESDIDRNNNSNGEHVHVVADSSSVTEDAGSSKPKKSPKKFKKAPGAPKRFRSAFILFSQFKHKEIQEQLADQGDTEKTTSIAKMVSEEWRNMNPEDRSKWENMALRDKRRFETEKASYQGPWTVPIGHRKSKDPSAPKRPASAFLSFSNSRRAAVKQENKQATNAEISGILSTMWKEAPDDLKKKYMDQEAKAREEYKKRMAEWRVENDKTKKRKKDPLELFEEEELKKKMRGIVDDDNVNDDDQAENSSDEGEKRFDRKDSGADRKEGPRSHSGVPNTTLGGNPLLNDLVHALGTNSAFSLERSFPYGMPSSLLLGRAPLAADVLRSQTLLASSSLALRSPYDSGAYSPLLSQIPLRSQLLGLGRPSHLAMAQGFGNMSNNMNQNPGRFGLRGGMEISQASLEARQILLPNSALVPLPAPRVRQQQPQQLQERLNLERTQQKADSSSKNKKSSEHPA